ncbi:MAG: 3-deoxy-D-manno-octulosonate 8-phosphate phosphatase, YrbI family [Pelosinus sp.]|jgi:3-deoxy-D-manno-octulosonate 8-phosphate phosphatase (KDO 8-P phosphatase)|nr:3-deoxy-D-manno-octulosonate 8-phosphate phosphatase, YrbI family [Pelosinus sp.]
MGVEARAKQIKLLILDVDGVLTDGHIIFGRDGELMKNFHSQDGLGITAAHKAGLKTAIISGRESQIVHLRSTELKITDVFQGAMNKVDALATLLEKYNLDLEEVAYVGDDLIDLSVMVQVGLSCAVANAVDEVKEHAHMVTNHQGGQGAVREVVEFILKSQGKWDDIVNAYIQGGHIETKQ